MYKTISCLVILALGTWVGGSINSAPSVPRIVAKVALTNQTGSIPATTLVTPTTSALYRISVYMVQVFPQTSTCNTQGECGVVVANFQWTDDGGTQVINHDHGTELGDPFYLQLDPASGGQDPCSQNPGGSCVPFVFPVAGLPGGSFLVRANAGTPLIYSVNLEGENGTSMAYDYFMTVEQLE